MVRRASLLLTGMVLTACTTVGPDYQAPAQPELPAQWNAAEAAQDARAVGAWWKLFEDPVLDELIEHGARQNLSLEAAGLRIVQARAALGISDSLVFPQQQQVNGNFSYLYRNEDGSTPPSVGLDVGWELDIWGKYARGIESAEASLYASIASYRDVLVSISAEIARNYINYRTAQERMYLSRRNIAIQQRVVDMTQVQFDSGNVSELDVQQARTQLYATEGALPALNIARLQARNAIAVLLGARPRILNRCWQLRKQRDVPRSGPAHHAKLRRPESGSGNTPANSVIPHAPRHLTTSIDPQLIMRRPDLQVAELRARAQSARIRLDRSGPVSRSFSCSAPLA